MERYIDYVRSLRHSTVLGNIKMRIEENAKNGLNKYHYYPNSDNERLFVMSYFISNGFITDKIEDSLGTFYEISW